MSEVVGLTIAMIASDVQAFPELVRAQEEMAKSQFRARWGVEPTASGWRTEAAYAYTVPETGEVVNVPAIAYYFVEGRES